MGPRARTVLWVLLLLIGPAHGQDPGARVPRSFDRDPGWEGHRNRLVPQKVRTTRQHFGHRPTRKAGGKGPGEIGGWVQRSIVPAYYAKAIGPKTLNDKLTASGRFAVHEDHSSTGTLFGWFNDKASRGWRTAHSLAFRIDGNGGKFWVFFEYGTGDWMTGGKGCFEGEAYQTTKTNPFRPDGQPHDFAITYDPAGANNNGQITVTFDGRRQTLDLRPGDKSAGATFDRFGVFNHQVGGNHVFVYFDDLSYTARR